jgi:hypothetical protein
VAYTHLFASGARCDEAGPRALLHQPSLELGQGRKDMEDALALSNELIVKRSPSIEI